MNYLDYLPEDIYTVIFAYIHPGDIVNLCITQNIKSIQPMYLLKSYFDGIAVMCYDCRNRTYDAVEGWKTNQLLCNNCIKECSNCESWMRVYPDPNAIYLYTTHPELRVNHGTTQKYIPGSKQNCLCGEYLCGDCVCDFLNEYRCKTCKQQPKK